MAIRNLCLLSDNYLLLTVPMGRIFESDKKIGHLRHYSLERLEAELQKNGFEIIIWKQWGFPFHSLYKVLINCITPEILHQKYTLAKYGFTQKLVSSLIYGIFFINDLFLGGCNLFVLAKKTV